MNAMKIAVAGASGRMGRMLIEAIAADPDSKLAGALDISGAPSLGTDAASFLGQPSGVLIEADLARGLADASDASFEIAAAKCRASDAVELLTRLSHQVHGAIGFTYEYDLQFLTRRLWSWRAEFGTSGEWGEYLGRIATATGGDRLWALVTA